MTKQQLADYFLVCASLAEEDDASSVAYVRPDALRLAAAFLSPTAEQRATHSCDKDGYVNRNGFLVCSGCGKTAGEIFQTARERAAQRRANHE